MREDAGVEERLKHLHGRWCGSVENSEGGSIRMPWWCLKRNEEGAESLRELSKATMTSRFEVEGPDCAGQPGPGSLYSSSV